VTEPPPPEVIPIHIPTITTYYSLMVDGLTQKLITVTDGVSYPVISSTTYPITYRDYDDTKATCNKVVFYSDNTSYRASTAQTRSTLSDLKTISNINRKQYSFVDVTEIDIYNQPQTIFPYIIHNNSGAVFAIAIGETVTQLWSDGKTYSKTF